MLLLPNTSQYLSIFALRKEIDIKTGLPNDTGDH